MKKLILSVLAFSLVLIPQNVFAGASLSKNLVEEEVEYVAGDTTLKGYFVYDKSIEGKRPGVIVAHEWWGHNDYARKRARQLAKMGYAAFALDMFGDGKTADHPDQAQKFVEEIMANLKNKGKVRFEAALDELKSKEVVDPERIAAIGYCFGGSMVLQMARYGIDLKGVVSFHGGLAMLGPMPKDRFNGEILVFNGADDKFITDKAVDEFQMDMKQAEVKYEMVNYPGVKHSFTNPSATKMGKKFDLPLEYNKKADKDSWEKAGVFLERVFSQ